MTIYGYIYIITNVINGKTYIGQTKYLSKRLNEHFTGLCPQCRLIHRAIQKYGKDAFVVEHFQAPVHMLDGLEIAYIKLLDTMSPYGYNLTTGGDGSYKRSDETRKRMSESNSGEKAPNYGKNLPPETREKLRIAALKQWDRQKYGNGDGQLMLF